FDVSAANSGPVVCEVCGAYFETRRGLSSHARLHLRQLGVTVSENSGAPIELLYQLIQDKDKDLKPDVAPSVSPSLPKKTSQQEPKTPVPPEDAHASSKMASPRASLVTLVPISDRSASPTPTYRVAPSSICTRSCSPSKSSSSSSKRPSDFTSPPTSPASKRPKIPETCTCVLCGERFENRKGLGSHARSHLKHMGVNDLVGKSSAIEAVQELVSSGVLEPMHLPKTSSTATASSSTAPSSALPSPVVPVPSPAASQSRTSFTPTGLSPSPSASSHSPQPPLNRAPKAKKGFRLAVDPLLKKPKPEPVEMEISVEPQPSNDDSSSVTQKAPAAASSSKPPESDLPSPPTVLCDFCGQLFDTRKALSCHVRAHLRQLGLTWSIRTSPIDLLKEVMLRREERKEPLQSGSSAAGKAAWSPPGFKRPPKEKPPPREGASSSAATPVDYSMKDKTPYGKSAVSNIGESLFTQHIFFFPLNFPFSDDLSMTLCWRTASVLTSFSHFENLAHALLLVSDATCELCGFDFENRKALASHCRAHLRQLGLYEWKADGATSPIETLSELIRRDPNKVAEITRRYRYGDLYIKKVSSAINAFVLLDMLARVQFSVCLATGRDFSHLIARSQRSASLASMSMNSDTLPSSSHNSSLHHPEHKASRKDHGIRTAREFLLASGVHAPQHGVSSGDENRHSHSRQPSRAGSIPALLPKPPLTPLVKLVGKIYSLKCRFCDEVFHGPLSVQEKWITHLQKHILSLGYKGKEAPSSPAAPSAPALVHPVAV
uniref:Si:dkey-217d24.6 n=1 Tax=Poecilia formosa TaxID=48698 RepID=A0A087Y448_POEFO